MRATQKTQSAESANHFRVHRGEARQSNKHESNAEANDVHISEYLFFNFLKETPA